MFPIFDMQKCLPFINIQVFDYSPLIINKLKRQVVIKSFLIDDHQIR